MSANNFMHATFVSLRKGASSSQACNSIITFCIILIIIMNQKKKTNSFWSTKEYSCSEHHYVLKLIIY